jgi:tight adherence protein C
MNQPWLLAAGVGAIFAAAAALILSLATGRTERAGVSRSLALVGATQLAATGVRGQQLQVPFATRVLAPAVDRFARLGRRITPADQVTRLSHRLDLAGNPAGWDADRVLAAKVVAAAASALLALPVSMLWVNVPATAIPLIVAGAGVLGWLLPNAVLQNTGQHRSQRIQRDLPDALDLLTISVEAGLAFDAALAQVARKTSGPVAAEFARVLAEVQIGRGRMDALRALSERTDVDELKSFVTAMVQADAFGIPIGQALRVQASEMRVKRRQRAEEKAQKVPVKILFPLMVCIMPALFVVIIGPGAISIIQNILGT